MSFTRLLIFEPHPDDAAIGAAGLAAKTLRGGGQVTIVTANSSDPGRMEEARASGAVMGGAEVVPLGIEDAWLDTVPIHMLAGAMEAMVQQHRPDCVVLPDLGSSHQEHRAVAQAGMVALRPSGGTGWHRPRVAAFYEQAADVWRTTSARSPNWFVALGEDEMARKVAAMEAHVSQVRPWPSERSVDTLLFLAKLRGSQAGVDAAEAYSLLWMLS
jgi:N-acetylglucosamine malate deacetylase 1